MRVRKVAKQLKLFHKNLGYDKDGYPVVGYKVENLVRKTNYILRMTRRHYFCLAKKYDANSMMGRLYIHKACSPYLYDEVLSFWGLKEEEL